MPVSAGTGFFPMRLTGDSPTGCAVETALTFSSFSPTFLLVSLPFPHGKHGSRKTDKTNVTAAKSARTSALKYLCISDLIRLMQQINFAQAVDCQTVSPLCGLGPRAAPEALVPADPILSLSLCTLFKTIFRPISLPPGEALTSSEGELQRTE